MKYYMIGEEAFKGFCRQAEEGACIRALFITASKFEREAQQLDMLNVANARDLPVLFKEAKRELFIRNSTALLRIAHPYLDRELAGLEFHFIHGLDLLNVFEDGEAIIANLKSRVRLPYNDVP